MSSHQEQEDAKKAAISFIKYRPRSEKEVRERLLLKKFSPEVIDPVIQNFREEGLLDDSGFARQWAESRVLSKNLSFRKIKDELRQKGINSLIISETIEYLGTKYDENQGAKDLLNKKFKNGIQAEKKEKLIRLLLRNGYSYSVSSEVIRELLDPDG